jgi:hypothetical protein
MIFDCEYLREIEAKIAKALTPVLVTLCRTELLIKKWTIGLSVMSL